MTKKSQATDEQSLVLWTGGWDSSFRVLQVALIEKRDVQPLYIDSGERKSKAHEIAAMDAIRSGVAAKFGGQAAARIKPTIYQTLEGVPDDPVIAQAHADLARNLGLGSQYKWLANFANHHGYTDLEMAAHWVDGPGPFGCHWLEENCEFVDGTYRVSSAPNDPLIIPVFEMFSFPILKLTKSSMAVIARDAGFLELMNLTHFCHNPRGDGTPCGRCEPCSDAIVQGMAHRIPRLTRLKMRLRPVTSVVRRVTGI